MKYIAKFITSLFVTDYNGSAEIIVELKDLLKSGKISTKSALPLLLKSQEYSIKKRSEMDTRIKRLEVLLLVYIAYRLFMPNSNLGELLDTFAMFVFP